MAVPLLLNPRARRDTSYPAPLAAILGRSAFERARAVVTAWPGYAPTPLLALDGLARHAGVGGIYYKDEAGRFGLGSFKALGGSYAVFHLLARLVHARTDETAITASALMDGAYRDVVAGITVTCATAGNHGRSVAWGARLFGCRCVIFLNQEVSQARADAIARYGAEIVRVPGTYDDAVRHADAEARRHGWHVVSDTSYPGYTDVPCDVMQGYTVMADEVVQQWPFAGPPTHVFVQCGVGGLAAAVCAHFWERWGPRRPRFVVVEPEAAACMYASAHAGHPVVVEGALATTMTCLACGEVSLLAWEVLSPGADAFMTIPDAAAAETLDLLRRGVAGDPPRHAGASGAAGLAGLLTAARDDEARRRLHLDPASRIVVIGSEGPA